MQNSLDKCLDDLDSPNASVRVEITPEMIEASLVVYVNFEDGDDLETFVKNVFRSMHEAQRTQDDEAGSPSG